MRNTLIALAMVTVVSCSYKDGSFEQVEGRYFDKDQVSQIKDGSTTEHEVRDRLGEPLSVSERGTQRELQYHSIRRRQNVEKVLLWTSTHSQTWIETLTVTTASGVVVKHTYRSNTIEK